MSLQNLINQENDENYISLFNAINLLAKNSNIYDVAIYLLNKNIHIDLDSYKENYDCKIIQSSFTDIPNKTWSGDNFAHSLLKEIVDIEIEKLFPQTTISGFDRYSELSQSTYWDKKQFFSNSFIMRALNHKTNKNCGSTELQPESQLMQTKEVPLLYLNDIFSLVEASCILSNDNPILMNRCFNDTDFDQNYPSFNEAYNFLNSAIYAGKLSEPISSTQLKEYLSSKGRIIDGFNDQLKNEFTDQNSIIDQLKKENEKLKAELLEKEQKIKEMELIQTTENKSKLGSTRAENNVSKLILALSTQAKIDTSKPYAQYESLKTQAELLGIDKFPSDENVASWLKKANSQNPT
ncbi:hypothetical protein ACFODO_01335 [Acinetobacter sichuanensis]|uniref:Uncharacterized protein n=1 Tax=Acinetobacter sichuanensis TaxID=2136183 RepID=A0A371YTT1_9GAMM|nr:hypothetical protein [Acinetobacter sichuanensis]RFC84886.1 hypothetical protein C9E89_002905 [Acinetobacter sichuanensis]